MSYSLQQKESESASGTDGSFNYAFIYSQGYNIRITAKNQVGISEASDYLQFKAGYRPDRPANVSTAHEGDKIKITWLSSVDNGSPITSYHVYILDNVG